MNENEEIIMNAFKKLDEKERDVIARMLHRKYSEERLNFLKMFVLRFDKDSQMDNIICTFMTQVGQEVGCRILEDIERMQEQGADVYSGKQALAAGCEVIRKIAAHIEGNMEDFFNDGVVAH